MSIQPEQPNSKSRLRPSLGKTITQKGLIVESPFPTVIAKTRRSREKLSVLLPSRPNKKKAVKRLFADWVLLAYEGVRGP